MYNLLLIRFYPSSTICIFLLITNRSFMHHLSCGISSLLHSVNLILFYSSPGSPHSVHITSSKSPPSLSPSVTAFHSRLITHLFHKSFPPEFFWFQLDCRHESWIWTRLIVPWRLFVVVSSFYIFLVSGYVC